MKNAVTKLKITLLILKVDTLKSLKKLMQLTFDAGYKYFPAIWNMARFCNYLTNELYSFKWLHFSALHTACNTHDEVEVVKIWDTLDTKVPMESAHVLGTWNHCPHPYICTLHFRAV